MKVKIRVMITNIQPNKIETSTRSGKIPVPVGFVENIINVARGAYQDNIYLNHNLKTVLLKGSKIKVAMEKNKLVNAKVLMLIFHWYLNISSCIFKT